MRLVASFLLASLLVAGCSNGPSDAGTQSTDEPEPEFDVEATETTGVIRGVVYDAAIRPLLNATVVLASLNQTTITGTDGAFGFEGLEPGTYFMEVSKLGYKSMQQSAEVVAGEDEPDIVKIMLEANPSTVPYFVPEHYTAYITCGAAIVATSVGCNTFAFVGEAMGDRVYFRFEFSQLPTWTQGELVWDHTQAAGGGMIWEIIDPNQGGTPQRHTGYRETTTSPALAYINTTLLAENEEWVVGEGNGVQYRIFAGPHPTCSGVFFGCGLTLQQQLEVYVHNFYNFAPAEGWRFTADGDPVVPA